jgi:DNA polymerase-3 subunit epsilon
VSASFVCIDVETANSALSSICQIGIVRFEHGKLASRWSQLIDPEDYFDAMNVSIHGIDERDVRDAPTLPEVYEELRRHLHDQVTVSHTSFDRASVTRALAKYNLPPVSCRWLDSARLVRRTWTEFSSSGYGLSRVCAKLEIQFQHHDAVEDARAAGEIVLRAMEAKGWDLDGCFKRIGQPINLSVPHGDQALRIAGNPDGPLAGEVVVFTGSFSLTKRELGQFAAVMGCSVAPNVTLDTTILVVGEQDPDKLRGKDKSSKHIKAEKLAQSGQGIRIIRESDFRAMVGMTEEDSVNA